MAARAGDHELVLFQIGEEVHSTDSLRSQEGGPMAQGNVFHGVVACPWHGRSFRTMDGQPTDGNAIVLRSFPVKVEEGRIFVKVEGAVASTAAPKFLEPPEAALKFLEVIEETHDTRTVRLDNSEGLIPIH